MAGKIAVVNMFISHFGCWSLHLLYANVTIHSQSTLMALREVVVEHASETKKSNSTERHIEARLVDKLERHDKTPPGMQDLAQELSTKVYERENAKNEKTTYPNTTAVFRASVEVVESSRGELAKDQRWKGSPSGSLIRCMPWGGFEDAMAKWSYTEKRLPTVSTCDTMGRTPVRPDRERAPLLVPDWRRGGRHGLEGASASVTRLKDAQLYRRISVNPTLPRINANVAREWDSQLE
ncbi:hypothetical protein DFH06DRAFT_1145400 [Mycena polygramma]|nr:hypothetical protein DFH06DRAFT_1145400 [Mycena polygramma]